MRTLMIMMRRTRRGEEVKRRRGAGTLRFACSVFLFSSLVFVAACGANESILRSGKDASPQANAESKTTFARELEAMRTADFQFVYVLRRKDGGPIDAEDRVVIKLQTSTANRRVAADDDKAFIIGTNAPIPPLNMAALYARFAVENYLPPPPANADANVKK